MCVVEGERLLERGVCGVGRQGWKGVCSWNRIEIQGLDDADGQGYDWLGSQC